MRNKQLQKHIFVFANDNLPYVVLKLSLPYVRLTVFSEVEVVYRLRLEALMRTEFLCISVIRVASGPGMKLASCKSALTTPPPLPPPLHNPVGYSTDRSKAVVPVLVLHFVALWFILRGNLF